MCFKCIEKRSCLYNPLWAIEEKIFRGMLYKPISSNKIETCWIEVQKDALSLRIMYNNRANAVSHKTSIHNHWTVSYHYKSSLRVCSIESMIVIRSFKMAHLRKNKSTFSPENVRAPQFRKPWSYHKNRLINAKSYTPY